MIHRLNEYFKPVRTVLGLMHLIGVVGLYLLKDIPGIGIISVPFLLFCFALLMAYHRQAGGLWLPMGFAWLAGFLAEWIGTSGGWLFGDYHYGKALGPTLAGVPLMIGINWALLTYMAWEITGRLAKNGILRILSASFLLTAFDWIMEPVAMGLDMWQWADGIIPLRNYAGWLLVSSVIFGFYAIIRFQPANRLSPWLFLYQAFFFLLLRFFII